MLFGLDTSWASKVTVFVVSLFNSTTVGRASTRTVTAYATPSVIADGEELVTVQSDEIAMSGYRYLGVGNGWSNVDSEGVPLPDLRGLSIAVSGENSSTEDDIATITTPLLITPEHGAIEVVLTPSETGQAGNAMLGNFTDTNNRIHIQSASGSSVRLIKRVGGLDNVATKVYTPTDGTRMRVQFYWDDVSGIGIRAADASTDITSVPFVTNANTQNIPIQPITFVGNQNNTAFFKATYENPIFHASLKTAGWV